MLFKKLIRTAWNYKAQFISMILMIAIGTGVFFGFNIEWYSLEKNMNKFIEDTNYADFRIYSEKGFSDEDIESVNKILGVKEAERIFSINIDVKDTKDALCLYAPEKHVVSKMRLIEGDAYDYNNNGIWLSDRYAKANGYKLGDTINLVYAGMQIDCQIVGLVKSMEHMICVADENQLMPDADIFGFAYVSPKLISGKFGREYYPQISITSDLSKEKLEEELEKCISETILVVPKDEHISYAGVTGEVEEGKTMAAILPVLFLSIAILTMITTMHRIAANEKVQIGTLKALGFNNKRILRHYTSYGLFLGIVGGAIGILLGFGVAKMIMSEDGSMGSYLDIPYWELYMPRFCWVVLVLTVLLQTAISYLSVRKMLAGTAADALRPYTPKKVKAMKIEKTAFFQKLSFATKWNFRDVVRHKTRSAMTIVGVIGCMLLLVGGLGM